MSKNDIRIEKLCGSRHWIDSHVRFTNIGDIIRVKNDPDKSYKVISNPVWFTSKLMWTVDMEQIKDV